MAKPRVRRGDGIPSEVSGSVLERPTSEGTELLELHEGLKGNGGGGIWL